MTALIDADSLVYILAWVYRDLGSEQEMRQSCSRMLEDILTLTGADDYMGFFSDSTNFRYRSYMYAPYKGNRPPKAEHVVRWESVIKNYYQSEYGFRHLVDLEADDAVVGFAAIHQKHNRPFVICSPDKDLNQWPGVHFDYRGPEAGTGASLNGQLVNISEDEAYKNFWTQMLMGDEGDNVAGIPGLGIVKARAFFAEHTEPMSWPTLVEARYQKYFGPHFGKIIFQQTKDALQMICPEHRWWDDYKHRFMYWTPNRFVKDHMGSIFDIS